MSRALVFADTQEALEIRRDTSRPHCDHWGSLVKVGSEWDEFRCENCGEELTARDVEFMKKYPPIRSDSNGTR